MRSRFGRKSACTSTLILKYNAACLTGVHRKGLARLVYRAGQSFLVRAAYRTTSTWPLYCCPVA